jgi:hypothetical protein
MLCRKKAQTTAVVLVISKATTNLVRMCPMIRMLSILEITMTASAYVQFGVGTLILVGSKVMTQITCLKIVSRWHIRNLRPLGLLELTSFRNSL